LSTKKDDISKLSDFILKSKGERKEIFSAVCNVLKENHFTLKEVNKDGTSITLASSMDLKKEGLLVCNFYEDGIHGNNLISSVSLFTAIALASLKKSIDIDILLNFDSIYLDKLLGSIENYSFIIAPSINIKTYEGVNGDNCTLNRIFFHNLKEAGIIDIEKTDSICCEGNDFTPIIRPIIGVICDKDVIYPSEMFSELTQSDKAKAEAFKAGTAIGLTFIDMMTTPSLVEEAYLERGKNS
ncbi:MAG: hypothetical protein LIR50_13590, partial [Bacillota bacterium]|nr:hypothetical protein [Bacillota bacterium]